MYFFVNRTLILDETEIPDPAIHVELDLIQAKYQSGFSENAVERMHSFARDLLDYSKPVEQLTYLNSLARDAIARFRERYDSVLGQRHSLYINFAYATKSDQPANDKVKKRAQNLIDFVKGRISSAEVELYYYGAASLLGLARQSPATTQIITIAKHFTTEDEAVVCLVGLKEFAKFLTDERGDIKRRVLEPNVRAYQGRRNPVNSDIRSTLQTVDKAEFWWLNNGVTILASKCSLAGSKLSINNPEIVNGLQTSQEIFTYFKDNPEKAEQRHVLIRVIVPPEDEVRTRITKATNFQTQVNPVSLHATDRIHFDIEERLKLYDLFYDRRKGHYRDLRKPISQIVSIHDLARAVIAIVLQRPNDARARPQTLLNNETTYKEIFDERHNRDLFVTSILIDRQVLDYLKGRDDLSKDERRNIRFYMDMLVASSMAGTATPSPQQIAALAPQTVKSISSDVLAENAQIVLDEYRRLGATDKVAKGADLPQALLAGLKEFYDASSGEAETAED